MDQEQERKDSRTEREERKEKGEAVRKELDEIPPAGTDPLHEGP